MKLSVAVCMRVLQALHHSVSYVGSDVISVLCDDCSEAISGLDPPAISTVSAYKFPGFKGHMQKLASAIGGSVR